MYVYSEKWIRTKEIEKHEFPIPIEFLTLYLIPLKEEKKKTND